MILGLRLFIQLIAAFCCVSPFFFCSPLIGQWVPRDVKRRILFCILRSFIRLCWRARRRVTDLLLSFRLRSIRYYTFFSCHGRGINISIVIRRWCIWRFVISPVTIHSSSYVLCYVLASFFGLFFVENETSRLLCHHVHASFAFGVVGCAEYVYRAVITRCVSLSSYTVLFLLRRATTNARTLVEKKWRERNLWNSAAVVAATRW